MKTAVSIPDDIYKKAERYARRAKKSRSEVYSAAVREYVARHSPEEITESWNTVLDEVGRESDPFVNEATRLLLEKVEWKP
jgi:metal-responsive CopG/Arc/MetJ family transcriptional regulator